ncbi:hypothetical protein CL630_03685 [bacterium]|nr:hypothetical protein [bacterium]
MGQPATTTSATTSPALIVSGDATFLSRLGVGTTSPWAHLTVIGQGTMDAFVVAPTAANTTHFIVDNSGFVGIGTTSPYTSLAVAGSTGVLANIFTATSTTATSTFAGGLAFETSGLVYDFSSNSVGIGVADADVTLEVFETVSGNQFKISYDATNNTAFQVDANGDLVINPSGDDIFLNADNMWVCTGGGCPTGSPSGTGNLIVETALGIASSTPWGGVFQYELGVAGDAVITGTTTLGNMFSFAPIGGTTTEIGLFDTSGDLILIFDEQE